MTASPERPGAGRAAGSLVLGESEVLARREAAQDPRRTSGRRVPDFFIIGHEKSGTTALYRMLKSHPEIYMPDLKEPRFFVGDTGLSKTDRGGGILPHTLDEYLELFAATGSGQIAGEASPQYIRSPTAAARIAELQPAARVIALLREPVSFLRSFHLQCARWNLENQRDFSKALGLEEQRRKGKRIPRGCGAPDRLLYSDHVRYVEQLRRFEDVLSREQILVVVYDDLRGDNDGTARSVLRFLGVDDSLPIDVSKSRGRTRKAVRMARLHDLSLALKRARRRPDSAPALLRAINSIAPTWLEPLSRRAIYADPRPLDEQVVRELRGRFKPEVVALSDYLGRDLVSEWGYDATT